MNAKAEPFGPPLIGALLRVPWEAVQRHMLEHLHERGFDDFDPAYLSVFRYPGPQGERPTDVAARLGVSKQAINYLLRERGYDLYACSDEDVTIAPHCTVKVGTGVSMAIPEGYFGAVYARSGLSAKQGLRPANCVGVVDSDYRGEIIVALHNDTDAETTIDKNERIAQIVVTPYLSVEFEETMDLDDTERGSGGFGSTGKL
jgi:dUTP pyrophosphatase